jgi:hypothetical protein
VQKKLSESCFPKKMAPNNRKKMIFLRAKFVELMESFEN